MDGGRIGWPEMPVAGISSEKVACPLFLHARLYGPMVVFLRLGVRDRLCPFGPWFDADDFVDRFADPRAEVDY